MPLIPPNPIDANTYLPGVQVIPAAFLITNITNSFPMIVSTGNTPEIEVFITRFPSRFLLTGLISTATIVPGSINITSIDGSVWTDPLMNGTLSKNGVPASGTIDYVSGLISPPVVPLSGTYSYFPNLSFVQPPNTYVVGQTIRLDVPAAYNMEQADGLIGSIVAINGTDFSLNIDSTNFDYFVYPASELNITVPASFSPAGSRNLTYGNNTQQVAFQNLNNVGN